MNTIANTVRNGIRIIKFNKPNRRNAVSPIEFDQIINILKDDSKKKNTNLCILTGSGDYFTSGLDFIDISSRDIKNGTLTEFTGSLRVMIEQIITYPKLLIAIVNGPAIGFGTTILPLCDYVYASEKAVFQSPFVKLGINAELCSSVTFPKIMGRSKATEMIFFGNKINVQEAYAMGLVGKIYADEKNIYEEIENIAKLPLDTVIANKKLIIEGCQEELFNSNKRETDMLQKTLQSKEFLGAVQAFLDRKK